MVTHEIVKFKIKPFWALEHRDLTYVHEPFNDPESLAVWQTQGYTGPVTGVMCDMKHPQPAYTKQIVEYFTAKGWKNIGTCFYRMDTGVVLPVHSDLYLKYISLFNLQGQEHKIYRAIVFLEDWQSGHYAEYAGQPYVNWRAGDSVYWNYDTPHMAANLGITARYTLQITGHL